MKLNKTIHLLLIVIIASSWFEDVNGFPIADRHSRTRKLPSLSRPSRQAFKPTRQNWNVQREWLKTMSVDQYSNQGMYSTELLPKIAKVLDIIINVFNLFQNSPLASSFLPQSGPNYNFNSPYDGSYGGSYPDGSDYIPISPSGPYDDSQPITAGENEYHQTPYKGSYDEYSTELGGLEIKNVIFFFLWILFKVYFR